MKYSKIQIVATIGPKSWDKEILREMVKHQMDVARLNMSWGDLESKKDVIKNVRDIAGTLDRKIPVIVDLPGPRIQDGHEHTFDHGSLSAITEEDKEFIKFAVVNAVEYVAVSFVLNEQDIKVCRKVIESLGGDQKVIAKIERKEALENLDAIINEADAVMIARGDLGNAIPLEQIPFIQERIVKLCKEKDKPVIVATEMMISMVHRDTPTRAEVTDVSSAVLEGADAVMLSEETAIGENPVRVVEMMEKIVLETEKHMNNKESLDHL